MENKLNEELNELNVLQQRLHIFDTQSRQLQLNIKEIDTSINETKKAKGKVYSIIGSIMIPKDSKTIISELEDQKSKMSNHLKILNDQISKLSKKSSEIQDRIQESIKDEKSK
jgi:prefoldin beta subunit|tara:strand:- start:372 stop:710 length:339 start_codon:yes stop_codon:yes gene_type:complete